MLVLLRKKVLFEYVGRIGKVSKSFAEAALPYLVRIHSRVINQKRESPAERALDDFLYKEFVNLYQLIADEENEKHTTT
jgi:hypothetical protein